MARRQHVTLLLAAVIAVFLLFTFFFSSGSPADMVPVVPVTGNKDRSKTPLGVPSSVLTGDVIAPKLENATAKAELGRAAWKVLHTMMARFPEKASADDSLALKTYIQLFARLYPCGECARHFQSLLAKYPPQTSGRNAAAGWACFVHNLVNKRLKKPEFDCNNIGDFYDCGCGDEDKSKVKKGSSNGDGELKGRANLSVEKEGFTRGG